MGGEQVQPGIGRGAAVAAGLAVNEAAREAMRAAGGDPKKAADALLARLRTDAALADALFVSFASNTFREMRKPGWR